MGRFGEWVKIRQLPLYQKLMGLRPQFAAAAQKVYDEWDASDEEFGDAEVGFGGICQDVASAMIDVLGSADIECRESDDIAHGEQHVWCFAWDDGPTAFTVDIPPSVYETGGGYSWQKIPGVTIEAEDVSIDPIERVHAVGEDDDW